MIVLAAYVNKVIAKMNSEAVVNSECTLGLTQRMFDSNARGFAEALLANPSVTERLYVLPAHVAKFVRKVLDDLDPKLVDGGEVKTVLAILSNPRLLHMVKEERDIGGLE